MKSRLTKDQVPLLPQHLDPTPGQVLGPYFLDNSPVRRRLFPGRAAGSRVLIKGQVLSTDGTPLANATIHAWAADPKGRYDNQDDQGNPLSIPASKQFNRGRVITDHNGRFSFLCLRPGNYFDDGYSLWRPAHIHIKVECDGHKELTTQLYFQDDAQNRHDIPGDDFFQPELAVHLSPAVPTPGEKQAGIFNFVLEKLS
jgi:protocatechuate 3,4-dioxygenase beta subunit